MLYFFIKLWYSLLHDKYQTPDGLYDFTCLDESDYNKIEDFSEDMDDIITSYQADGCKILWIKEMSNYSQLA